MGPSRRLLLGAIGLRAGSRCLESGTEVAGVRRLARTTPRAQGSLEHKPRNNVWTRRYSSTQSNNGNQTLSKLLEDRGLVYQIIGEPAQLNNALATTKAGVYLGVDPTASSLHVGHLLPLMALLWIHRAGHPVFPVVGGFTATIGDPTGRTTARAALQQDEVMTSQRKIEMQLRTILSAASRQFALSSESKPPPILILNNGEWLGDLKLGDFMKPLGFHCRLGALLGRDTVKTRLQNGSGMSVSEFLYPVVQAWDWWHLWSKRGVQIQIGGSDQYGNIFSGADVIDAIGKEDKENLAPSSAERHTPPKPVGFTVPLLTTSSGEKFGKSAGNAVWLDPSLTSPFQLYQFFVGTADEDVQRYLKLLTFEPLDVIEDVMADHEGDRSRRVAQHCLARNIVEIVHGAEVAQTTKEQHALLFGSRSGLSVRAIRSLVSQSHAETRTQSDTASPSAVVNLPASLVLQQPLGKILHSAALAESKSAGQRLVSNGGAYFGQVTSTPDSPGDQVTFVSGASWIADNVHQYLIDGNLLLLRAGKQKVKIVEVIME